MTATCLVCGRELKATASTARQVGPVCLAKLLSVKHVTARSARRRPTADRPLTGFPELPATELKEPSRG